MEEEEEEEEGEGEREGEGEWRYDNKGMMRAIQLEVQLRAKAPG